MKLITHSWNGSVIAQLTDAAKIAQQDIPAGHVNASQVCKAGGKLWGDYVRLEGTKAYWEGLSRSMGIPIDLLVITISTGKNEQRGTWTHPEIAIDCAQWVSVEFRIWANSTLRQIISGQITQPMTQAEILLMQAQRLVDQEKKLLAIESAQVEQSDRLNAVEAEQGRYSYPGGHKFTVMGFANLNGINISAKEAANKGRKASLICRTQNITVERIHDPRFGKVGIYPTEILVEVFKGG